MNDLIQLTAPIDVKAGPEGKPARVSILAYTGGPMFVEGWSGPVALDLAGVKMPHSIPLLADHNSTIAGLAGVGFPRVEGGRLMVDGTLASNENGQRIVGLHRDGIPMQASLGAQAVGETIARLREGEVTKINGRSFKAGPQGLTVIKTSTLKEVSILPLGADGSTTVNVTAKAKGINMDVTEVSSVETEGQQPDLVALERTRVNAIHALARRYAGEAPAVGTKINALADQAVDENWDVRAAELAMIRGMRPAWSGFWHGTAGGGAGAITSRTYEAAILARVNEPLAVKSYGAQEVESARRLRASNLYDVVCGLLNLSGRDTSGMSRNEVVQAGFSTLSIPTALSNVMGKALLDSYTESTASWRGFASIKPASNFKEQTSIRPSFVGELEPLAPTGEIKHGSLAESTFNWNLGTYAKMFSVDRQAVINDDLGFIDETPKLLGKAAARAINDLVWSVVMANAGSFFAAGHHNLVTGHSMDGTGLAAAILAMKQQRDDQSNDIMIQPNVLAVPPELEFAARQWVQSALMGTALETPLPSGNPYHSLVSIVSESRLSNTAKFTHASASTWYLFGLPSDASVIVGFLDGKDSPTIETFGFDHQANVLALTFRCYHDFACALGDWRAAVKVTA